jgi:hypothetical protein
VPIADLKNLIIEEKALQIVDKWADAVVEQLRLNIPVASGALADAMLARSQAERVPEGWVVGIGDMNLIGAGPLDAPPRGTISAFLEIWRSEAGGMAEVAARQERSAITQAWRQRQRRERARGAVSKDKGREAERRTSQAFDDAERRIKRIESELGSANAELVRREEWVGHWEDKQQKRERELEGAIRKSKVPTGLGVVRAAGVGKKYEETFRYKRKVQQIRLAEARKAKWEARVVEQAASVEALKALRALWKDWLADELRERLRKLRGG